MIWMASGGDGEERTPASTTAADAPTSPSEDGRTLVGEPGRAADSVAAVPLEAGSFPAAPHEGSGNDGPEGVGEGSSPPPPADVPAADESDYYAVLGLSPDASAGEITRAYRRLAKEWHPDRYLLSPLDVRASAEQRMRALNRAYATLGDPLLRREYDYDHAPETPQGAGAPSGWAGGMSPSYVRYGTMPRSAWRGQREVAEEPVRAGNPLDVGDFFGLLALILALGIFAGSLREAGGGVDLGSVVGILLGAALFVVAMISFAHGALLVRAAGERLGGSSLDASDEDASWAWRGPFGADIQGGSREDPVDPVEAEAATRFDALVDEALSSIPSSFLAHMPNLLVDVALEPTPEQLRSSHVGPGYTLLGLYVGVPLTAQGVEGVTPEYITIFRGPIERLCQGNPDRIRAQVRATVLHEIAHHFGIDHDDMPDWVK